MSFTDNLDAESARFFLDVFEVAAESRLVDIYPFRFKTIDDAREFFSRTEACADDLRRRLERFEGRASV